MFPCPLSKTLDDGRTENQNMESEICCCGHPRCQWSAAQLGGGVSSTWEFVALVVGCYDDGPGEKAFGGADVAGWSFQGRHYLLSCQFCSVGSCLEAGGREPWLDR